MMIPADDSAPGGDYNLLPYPSLAYDFTQPSRLAALAALHGLDAPAVDHARVLEIGGASGGNIIALAARFPHARFLGVDLSTRHIDEGSRRIEVLGLKNIELRQADVTTLALPGQQFDYILCHGVFSWVPRAAQEAILRLCNETLSPEGIALISYNVLPGWHLRSVVRDICLQHAGRTGTPRERVTRARKALAQIARETSESDPYGRLLRNEAERLAQRPSAYILGEFLVETNTPLYFQEFSDRAALYGLGYLCEADLSASTPRVAHPEVAGRIRNVAGAGAAAFEQHVDFVTGRTFRRSLLVRAARANGARSVDPRNFRPLHFSAEIQWDATRSDAKVSVFKDRRGRDIRADDAAVRHALARLAQSYPATLSLAELAQAGTEGEARVCKALYLLTATGQILAFSVPLATGRAEGARPCVWPLARAEAAGGQGWLSTLSHTSVPLDALTALLLPHMDGRNDRLALVDLLCEALRRKEVSISELRAEDAPWPEVRLREVAAQYVERVIRALAARSLLQPEADLHEGTVPQGRLT